MRLIKEQKEAESPLLDDRQLRDKCMERGDKLCIKIKMVILNVAADSFVLSI